MTCTEGECDCGLLLRKSLPSRLPRSFSTQQTRRHSWPFGTGAELRKRFSQHLPLTGPSIALCWSCRFGFGPGCRGALLLSVALSWPAALGRNQGQRGFCKHVPGFGNFLSRFGQHGADAQLMLVQREHSCVQNIEHLNEGQSRRFPLSILARYLQKQSRDREGAVS
jgi:hypothetical protein